MLSKLWHGLWRRRYIECPRCKQYKWMKDNGYREAVVFWSCSVGKHVGFKCYRCKDTGRVTAPLISTGMWITIGMALVLCYCIYQGVMGA